MNLAFELLLSEGDHNHTLGENIEKCLIDVDLGPNWGEPEKIYFLCFTAYTVPTRRLAGRERRCKGLICGGPCRGRTYGPLIKSAQLGGCSSH
jgi:hypothetical protein